MSEQRTLLEQKFMQGFEHAVPEPAIRQILLHAIEIFARKGLDGTKIKDIAGKAGFSQGYVYNYFKSKDDIFTKLVDLAADGAGDAVRYAAELDGTPYDKIYWLTEALLSPDSIAMQHWRLILLQATTSEAIPEQARRISQEKMKKPFEHFIPLLVQGQQAGQIVQEPPLVLAVAYFSIIQGLALTRVQNGAGIAFPSTELILRFLRKSD